MHAMVQKNWPTDADEEDGAPPLRGEGLGEDQCHTTSALSDGTLVLHGEEECEQKDPAADRRIEDGTPDPLGRRVGRRVRLLGKVGRGVVARDGVLRQQGPDGQDDEDEAPTVGCPVEEAGVVDGRGEDHFCTRVMVRKEDQDQHDRRSTDHVPVHRDVVEDRQQVTREDVGQCGQDEDHQEVEEDPVEIARRVMPGEEKTEREVEERGASVSHRGDDGQKTDQVQPTRVVPGLDTSELRGPPVDAARGRVRRHQFRQAESDAEHERGEDRPTPRDGSRTAAVPAGVEGGEATGQDGDDGEADGEVGEPGPTPVQLLLVTESGERLLVLGQ